MKRWKAIVYLILTYVHSVWMHLQYTGLVHSPSISNDVSTSSSMHIKTQHFSLQLTGFFFTYCMDQGEEGGRSGHTVSKYSVIPRSYCWGLNFPEVREKWAEIYDCQVDSCGEDPKRELASRDARSGEQQPRSSRYRERKRGGTSSCVY